MEAIYRSFNDATYSDVRSLFHTLGNRSRDFVRCFDITSPWCHRYAYVVLAGFRLRNLSYYEQHHIVPIAYYRLAGLSCDRQNPQVCRNNLTSLNVKEHIFVHFCMAQCCLNSGVKRKLVRAFYLMFYGISKGSQVYSAECASNNLLRFNAVNDICLLSHLREMSLTRKRIRRPLVVVGCKCYHTPKYPIAVWCNFCVDIKDLCAVSLSRVYYVAPIYNTRMHRFRSSVQAYIKHIRELAVTACQNKNVRFNDYLLRPVPIEYVARFLSVCLCHRVWLGSLIETLDNLDSYLGLPQIHIPVDTACNSTIYLGCELPLPKSVRKHPIRYKKLAYETSIIDEPLVLLNGRTR